MARVIIEDLDPMLISKLEALAQEHGRVLQAELKSILETAAQSYQGQQPTAIHVRELSGILYQPGQKTVSLEEMDAVIAQGAGESL